jgi:hypothetical protein
MRLTTLSMAPIMMKAQVYRRIKHVYTTLIKILFAMKKRGFFEASSIISIAATGGWIELSYYQLVGILLKHSECGPYPSMLFFVQYIIGVFP